ncbi:MAG: hypothetical protein JW744_03530 [Candidatus Diapherotrites archaeon]|uniref:Putative asparagine synthetase [glutamine-hydrolyzing] n=1 Tax=Candidatus Iainarchaeum sp. TaxID=3101447 RepID=A0A938YY65_9ARCH|nr:hypothetical protein [Candidatus Diapherotrites archaeon]
MCGIIGGFLSEQEAQKSLDAMQRGNDGSKILSWEGKGLSLGFQRLAIISPEDEESLQPILSSDSQAAIAMNGEIFPYRQLREQLKKQGFKFKSRGDAEVLLNLYLHKGLAFLDELDSMFSAAIFDFKSGKILLFRDWVGELPLHYIHSKERKQFVFASEFKALMHLPYYSIGAVETVKPGTILELDLESFELKEHSYYKYPEGNPPEYKSLKEIGKRVNELMKASAEERIISDVPVCCLFSGGVDSMLSAILLRDLLKKQGKGITLYTFHIEGQPVTKQSDLFHAERAAKELGFTDLRIVKASKEEVLEKLPEIIFSLEEKRGKDFNLYPAIANFFLAERIAADGFKVVFTGEGADELLGSYGSSGNYKVSEGEVTSIPYRKKLLQNLFKGVLMRTSKVMLYNGPIESRTIFLNRPLAEYMMNIPAKFLRKGKCWKMPFVEAFKGDVPEKLLSRPKARFQVATGITALKPDIEAAFSKYGGSDEEIFKSLFQEKFGKN